MMCFWSALSPSMYVIVLDVISCTFAYFVIPTLVVSEVTLCFGLAQTACAFFLCRYHNFFLFFFLSCSHVINELIETERVYVEELFTVLTVSDFFRSLITAPQWLVQKSTCHSVELSSNVMGQVSTKLSDPPASHEFSSSLPFISK